MCLIIIEINKVLNWFVKLFYMFFWWKNEIWIFNKKWANKFCWILFYVINFAGFRSSEELEEPYDEHFEAKMRSVAMVKAEEEESLHSVFIVADEEKDGRDPVELPPPPYATDYGE